MKILITGGVKNGKSSYAEELAIKLSKDNDRYYLATMVPYDDEDKNRIKKHQLSRKDKNFKTIEIQTDIDKVLDICDKNSTFLLDSLTSLVLNEMFKNEGLEKEEIINKIKNDLKNLVENVTNIVIVSDYIFSDFQNFSDFTDLYLQIFGDVSCYLASICGVVIERIASRNNILKGELK